MADDRINEYVGQFTRFYCELARTHSRVFRPDGKNRIGSTFKATGSALDAQTLYMQPVLEMIFEKDVVRDMLALARAVMLGRPVPSKPVERLKQLDDLRPKLHDATEAGSRLTAKIGNWSQGTDLFANIMANTDFALQMAQIYDHSTYQENVSKPEEKPDTGTLDQSAIDDLFD